MQTVATVPQPPSPGAERMKRLRERRRTGRMCFMFELDPREISGLVELKWLPGSQRDDRAAVVNAFCRLVEYVLVTQHEYR
jgi:hypothetical protein